MGAQVVAHGRAVATPILAHPVSPPLHLPWTTPSLQDNRLEAQPGSRLPAVIDSHGREVDRNALVQREQTVGGRIGGTPGVGAVAADV